MDGAWAAPWLGRNADVFMPALVLAFVVDRVLGEPAGAWHPVVWMGRFLAAAGRRFAPHGDGRGKIDLGAFSWGLVFWCVGALAVVVCAAALQQLLLAGPSWLAAAGLALLFKPMFAWAMLRREVRAVEDALAESVPAGRERLSYLCSRDVGGFDAGQVRETAIESLAENLNDSVVAPVFWFVLFGLPGAALYRYANTADAMWGYVGLRGGRDWTWAGKWAARADDVLSWLPARLTAVLLLAMAARRLSWPALRREAGRTPSPNGGWPMAAMALILGVRLGKPGVYALNAQGASPRSEDTARAIRLAQRAVLGLLALAVLGLGCAKGAA
ncbi:adenosylcobinamide-phosphate synthase CbiB [Bordetella sp. FB-8]|uniref:adenosylcobinamide-phosphate synthase CbiB n=1 Tax=Bordetella sp. FB-8 TaxID=1159870 RepID=UPI00035FEEFE|nr:adenosylcobinamide-phosphate synthase CbiB [Bordetella sp. FB-8]